MAGQIVVDYPCAGTVPAPIPNPEDPVLVPTSGAWGSPQITTTSDDPCYGTVSAVIPDPGDSVQVPVPASGAWASPQLTTTDEVGSQNGVIVTDPQGPQIMVSHEGTPIETADPPEGSPNTTWWLDSPATQIVLSSVEGPQRYA